MLKELLLKDVYRNGKKEGGKGREEGGDKENMGFRGNLISNH